MRTAEIVPGRTYVVRLTEQQAMIWRGCRAEATVVRAGFTYDVEHRRGSAVRGAPFVTDRPSAHPNGVEVVWQRQTVIGSRRHFTEETLTPGRAIINARAVLYPKDDPKEDQMSTETKTPKKRKPASQRSSIEAAVYVLERADGPMSAGAIADEVLRRRLCRSLKGETPKATITAQIYLAAKKPDGPVIKTDEGFVLRSAA